MSPDGKSCGTSDIVFTVRRHETQYMITSIIMYVCIAIMVICTIYICCKLTICRDRIQSNIQRKLQERNRRSAIIVVLICIIFILSEAIHVVATIIFSDANSSDVPAFAQNAVQFVLISWEIGFALNFVVYLILSKQLRNKIMTCFKRICFCKKTAKTRDSSTSSIQLEKFSKFE